MSAATKPACLITGATDGVGKSTAFALAKRGFRVVIAARDEKKAAAVVDEIVAATGARDVEFLIADLASLRQVQRLASEFRARFATLDVLVNNAGVFLGRRTETEDGFETTFQVNYLSHFALTHALLEPLKKSRRVRIVNLSSSVHKLGRFHPENLQSERHFSALRTYATSKLLMVMFTEELATRLAGTGITANAVHPGVVRTPMMLRAPGALRILSALSLPFSISAERGAEATVHLATSPSVDAISGAYFARTRPSIAKNAGNTASNRALLWKLSLEMTSLDAATSPRRSARS